MVGPKHKSPLLTKSNVLFYYTPLPFTDQSLPNAVKHLMSFKINIDIFLNVVIRKAGIKLHLNYFLKIR